MTAANVGDRELVYEMFGPRTRAVLETRALHSTKIVGGARRFEPLDLISIGQSGEREAKLRLVEVTGNNAVVEIGGRHRLNLDGSAQ
jgi:hypothetical protein